ncbi:MAG TPA: A/G-specific adenine glycosylase, partial [Spirochaetia bacterium]|nr:A/G-specific adenine glycosylase [Spirochaetia bacterium]
LPIIERTLDTRNPREWYYALMDYGVYLRSLFSNPNRRSVHYTRQSRFENSNRQVRGAVIRELLSGDVTAAELALRTSQDEKRVRQVLKELSEEGMIAAEDGENYRIR